MFEILVAAVLLVGAFGLVVPLVDPGGQSALSRVMLGAVVDSRLRSQSLPWPRRIFRWIVMALAVAGLVLLVTNINTLVDWFTNTFLLK